MFSSPEKVQTKSGADPAAYYVGTVGSLGVVWLGHEADHSPPPSVKGKNEWMYIPIPLKCLHVVYKDNLSLPFLVLNPHQNNADSIHSTGFHSEA
jgi:hypothetical protein